MHSKPLSFAALTLLITIHSASALPQLPPIPPPESIGDIVRATNSGITSTISEPGPQGNGTAKLEDHANNIKGRGKGGWHKHRPILVIPPGLRKLSKAQTKKAAMVLYSAEYDATYGDEAKDEDRPEIGDLEKFKDGDVEPLFCQEGVGLWAVKPPGFDTADFADDEAENSDNDDGNESNDESEGQPGDDSKKKFRRKKFGSKAWKFHMAEKVVVGAAGSADFKGHHYGKQFMFSDDKLGLGLPGSAGEGEPEYIGYTYTEHEDGKVKFALVVGTGGKCGAL